MTSVLDGIRVLDLSSGIAGPVAGMLLADHGADVVKIEPPGGDPRRGTPGYDTWLRGRRSAELDLHDAADRATFLALARTADVVIESFSPGVTERLGIDADTLLAANPRLVYCSITAYGARTSFRDRPGYDTLVSARVGTLYEQRGHLGGAMTHMNREDPYLPELEVPEGMEPGSPRDGPIFTYTPWLSFATAFNASLGINAALLARETTGRGQHVETSLLQAAFTVTASKWIRVEDSDSAGFRTWVYDRRATKGMFQCADGRWVQHWVPNPTFALSSADGDTLQLRRDVDRVHDDPDRVGSDLENIVVLAHYFPLMADAFRKFPSDDWVRVAADAGVPLQPVRTPEEALVDPALVAEGAVTDVPHPEYGSLRQAGILYGLSETPGTVQGPVPRVGEHTAAIRAEAAADAAPAPAAATSAAATLSAPLAGVTVLDLGFAVAGPFGTQLLADLGANVIKVNAWRDPYWHANHIAYGANRGKRSIGIDLKTPEGLAVLHRLVERADVVHSNMRRDALHRLKVDEASLREVNPDIVYVHTRGFDRGPRSDSPGNDQTGCSLAGVTFEDGGCRDGGRPFWSLTSLGDTGNGFLSAIGVLQALYHRKRTGVAQSVDTSILNAGLLSASMTSLRPDGTPAAPSTPRRHAARTVPALPALRSDRRMGVPRRAHRRTPRCARERARRRSAAARRQPRVTPRGVVRVADGRRRVRRARCARRAVRDRGRRLRRARARRPGDAGARAGREATAPQAGPLRAVRRDDRLLQHAPAHPGSGARRRPAHARDHARARLRRRRRRQARRVQGRVRRTLDRLRRRRR